MVSIEHKFLFIHVPKTGGNSIQSILKQYSEDKIVSKAKYQDGVERFGISNDKYNIHKHSNLEHYKQEIEPEIYKQLFKFSTIRNPWDRCISSYFSPHRGDTVWNRGDFKNFINAVQPITNYIKIKSPMNRVLDTITETLHIEIRSKPIDSDIDFLIRFENLNEDFKKVCELTDIPFEELPHRNKSSKKGYAEYYDDELIELVRKRFSDEIEYANYKYGNQ